MTADPTPLFVFCIFIGGPLHGEHVHLESPSSLLWRPVNNGLVAAYGERLFEPGLLRAIYAPIGISDSVFQDLLQAAQPHPTS